MYITRTVNTPVRQRFVTKDIYVIDSESDWCTTEEYLHTRCTVNDQGQYHSIDDKPSLIYFSNTAPFREEALWHSDGALHRTCGPAVIFYRRRGREKRQVMYAYKDDWVPEKSFKNVKVQILYDFFQNIRRKRIAKEKLQNTILNDDTIGVIIGFV